MENYELTLVFDGKMTPAKRKTIVASVEKIIAVLKGKIGKVEEWGEKELAYQIGKSQSGYFIHYPLELEPNQVKALNLKLKMEDEIIRYLLVRKEK